MNSYHYILTKDKKIEPIEIWCDGKIIGENLDKWAENFDNVENRKVAFDEKDGLIISTVFLGIDHGLSLTGENPMLFETAISIDDEWEVVDRYLSYDDAMEGHKKWIKKTSSQS